MSKCALRNGGAPVYLILALKFKTPNRHIVRASPRYGGSERERGWSLCVSVRISVPNQLLKAV